jgi:hypothetical protein
MATNGDYIVKVSEKGAISLYGLRRFPISFYKDEWETLGKLMPKILAYAKKHQSELKDKAASKSIEGGERL